MAVKHVTSRYLQILLRGSIAGYLFAVTLRKKPPVVPKSIAIVHNVQLGDMVCTTPLFRAIKKAWPNTRLIVAGGRINKEILEGNTDVDEYLIYDQANPDALSRSLRERRVEIGIVPSPSLESLLVLAFARTPYVIASKLENGWSPYSTRLYQLLCKFVVTAPHVLGAYAPGEYLRLLVPLGIHAEDTTKHLSFSSEAAKKISELLSSAGVSKDQSFVCITPGAGNKVKEWPAERFAKVAEHIWNTYRLPIVIIGSHVDQEEVDAMVSALGSSVQNGQKLINTCGLLSIDELKALIARARLLIGVDTGPIYIAEAFNTPLIDIVGPVGENEQPPFGKDRIVVVPPGKRTVQLHIMNARVYDADEARRQVLSTTVEMVTAAVDTLLGKN